MISPFFSHQKSLVVGKRWQELYFLALFLCQESSMIHSNANLGVHGQGLLNLSGPGDLIEAQRLILSLFYSIHVRYSVYAMCICFSICNCIIVLVTRSVAVEYLMKILLSLSNDIHPLILAIVIFVNLNIKLSYNYFLAICAILSQYCIMYLFLFLIKILSLFSLSTFCYHVFIT